TALVATIRLPAVDKFARPAYFQFPLLLDARFVAGSYRVVYFWTIAATLYGDADSFEIAEGGQEDGAGLALFYFERPTSSFALVQTDSGRIIRRRNPRL